MISLVGADVADNHPLKVQPFQKLFKAVSPILAEQLSWRQVVAIERYADTIGHRAQATRPAGCA